MSINSVPVTYNFDLGAIVQQICVQWFQRKLYRIMLIMTAPYFVPCMVQPAHLVERNMNNWFKLLMRRAILRTSLMFLLNTHESHGTVSDQILFLC